MASSIDGLVSAQCAAPVSRCFGPVCTHGAGLPTPLQRAAAVSIPRGEDRCSSDDVTLYQRFYCYCVRLVCVLEAFHFSKTVSAQTLCARLIPQVCLFFSLSSSLSLLFLSGVFTAAPCQGEPTVFFLRGSFQCTRRFAVCCLFLGETLTSEDR